MADAAAPLEAKFQPEAVAEYIQGKGWAYRMDRKGENYQIQFCPFCDNDRYNFEVHRDKGCFSCWGCEEKGGFYKLKEKLGDAPKIARFSGGTREDKDEEPGTKRAARTGGDGGVQGSKNLDTKALTSNVLAVHGKIWERPTGLAYLRSRGFNDEAIAHFKLGCVKQEGIRWLTVPHFDGDECVNVKYRKLPPNDESHPWKSHPGGRKVLFNSAVLKDVKEIIIVEGELKAVALWQMGFRNVVSLTAGVRNFYAPWVDQIEHIDKIWLNLDNDKEGQRNAEVLANRLGLDRVYNVVTPDAKDADEYFFQKGHDAADYQKLLDHAKRYNVKNLVSMQQALWQLSDELAGRIEEVPALMTPWREVNRLTKGFRAGEMVVISAPPKIGKTTFALGIIHNLAVNHDVPGLLYCVEMGPKRLARKIISLDNELEEIYFDEDIAAETALRMMHKPLYIPERVRDLDVDTVIETCRAAYRRYGVRIIVFDNLHFLVRNPDRQRELLGAASQKFKLLAEELQIPVLLVVHPRKLKKDSVAMTANDLKDTSAIHADADMVIVLHRKRIREDDPENDGESDPEASADDLIQESILEPETQVIVDAARYTQGGKTKLYYEGAESRFRSLDRDERGPAGGSTLLGT